MKFQSNISEVHWRLHLKSSPDNVFQIISTDEGRGKFWADTTTNNSQIKFRFPNSFEYESKILYINPSKSFSLTYLGGTEVSFELQSDGKGGTDLSLSDEGIAPDYWAEVLAGWGSVLMALKGAVDFGIDLRNNDSSRTWDQGYFDN